MIVTLSLKLCYIDVMKLGVCVYGCCSVVVWLYTVHPLRYLSNIHLQFVVVGSHGGEHFVSEGLVFCSHRNEHIFHGLHEQGELGSHLFLGSLLKRALYIRLPGCGVNVCDILCCGRSLPGWLNVVGGVVC